MRMKRLLSALVLACVIAFSTVAVKADYGCSPGANSCNYWGSYFSWSAGFWNGYQCHWTYTYWYDNGSYIYDDSCGGGSSLLQLDISYWGD